jgi:hypothetical protein
VRSLRLGSRTLNTVHSRAHVAPGRFAFVKGIRRLFLPHVGMRDSVKHLFDDFQNSLWDRRENYQDVPQERRPSDHSRLHEPARRAPQQNGFLPDELESFREVLRDLLSGESCTEWLGFNDLARQDITPPLRRLAGLVREPDWTHAENVHKLRMYRAAAFTDWLRPNVLDWETPSISDMEWVLKFIEVFTRPGISIEEQTDLIDDLSRPRVPLETIVQTTRGSRLELSASDLRYVWETKDLSHHERATAWDNRTPKPFQPFGCSNVEMRRDKKLVHRWRVAVNHQLSKARALYDSAPGPGQDEDEAN